MKIGPALLGVIAGPRRSGGDPYFGSVVFLMHFEGTDGSAAPFLEVTGKTISVSGDVQHDTAQFKFGASSGLFDGLIDEFLSCSGTGLDITTQDFTIEAWVRLTTVAGFTAFASRRSSTGADYNWQFYQSGGVLGFTCWGPTAGTSMLTMGGGTLTAGTWHHVAVTRNGSDWKIFLDGVVADTDTNATAIVTNVTEMNMYIGWDSSNSSRGLTGWMDELRITIGVARYTGAFTPPSAAFPDF